MHFVTFTNDNDVSLAECVRLYGSGLYFQFVSNANYTRVPHGANNCVSHYYYCRADVLWS